MTQAGASAAAYGATISVTNDVVALEAALAHARELAREQWFHDQVARAEEKLERARADVAGAEQALVDARSQLAAFTGAADG